MALKQNGGEGQGDGTAILGSTSTASGAAFTVSKGSGSPTMIYSSTSVAHGSVGFNITPVASNAAALVFGGMNTQSGAVRFYLYFPTLPSVTTTFCAMLNTAAGTMAKFNVTGAGRVSVSDNAGIQFSSTGTSPVGTLLANTWYRVEMAVTAGATSTTGTIHMAVYAMDSTTPLSGLTYDTTTVNTTSSFFGSVQVGKFDAGTDVNTFWLDDIAINDGLSTFIGPYVTPSPPTAAFTPAVSGLTATFDASASTAAGGAAISTYAWSYGDGGTGTGVTSSHTYSSSGTYTTQLTVTDSNAQQSVATYVVQVAPSSGSVGAGIVALASGFSMVGTTTLTPQQILNGTDPTKWIQSPVNPTAAQQPIPLIAPLAYISGNDVRVVMYLDLAGGGTSGTVDVTLMEGATTRSTVTGTTVPLGSGASVIAQVAVTFPAAQVAAVTDWSQVKVVPSLTGA